eukprot:m.193077 g.193077  ORF g.193077 m.193077 type:complete len:459 (+) comp18825_c0_seq1:244-1620(+)
MFRSPGRASVSRADAEAMRAVELAERRRADRRRRDAQVAAVADSLRARVVQRLKAAQKPQWEQIRDAVLTVVWYAAAALLYISALSIASFVLYSIVYLIFIPTAEHTFPVHLQFAPNGGSDFPVAVLPLLSDGSSRLLSRNQGYNIRMRFIMPESAANFDSGMMMVTLSLGSTQQAVEAAMLDAGRSGGGVWCEANCSTGIAITSSRAAVLRHRSWLLYCIRTVTLGLPLLLGLLEESQTIEVPLFHNTYDNTTTPYAWAAVRLSEPRVHIYSSHLTFHVHFTGASYLMHDWFYSSFVVGVSLTACGLVCTNIFAVWVYFKYTERQQAAADSHGDGGGIDGEGLFGDGGLDDEIHPDDLDRFGVVDVDNNDGVPADAWDPLDDADVAAEGMVDALAAGAVDNAMGAVHAAGGVGGEGGADAPPDPDDVIRVPAVHADEGGGAVGEGLRQRQPGGLDAR